MRIASGQFPLSIITANSYVQRGVVVELLELFERISHLNKNQSESRNSQFIDSLGNEVAGVGPANKLIGC